MTSELQRRTVWGLEPENQLYIKAYLFLAESKTLVAPVKHSSSAKLSSLFLTGKPAPGEHRDRRTKLTLQPLRGAEVPRRLVLTSPLQGQSPSALGYVRRLANPGAHTPLMALRVRA